MITISEPESPLPKFPAAFKLIPSKGEKQNKKLIVLFFSKILGVTIFSEDSDSEVTGDIESWVSCNDTRTWRPVDVTISH